MQLQHGVNVDEDGYLMCDHRIGYAFHINVETQDVDLCHCVVSTRRAGSRNSVIRSVEGLVNSIYIDDALIYEN